MEPAICRWDRRPGRVTVLVMIGDRPVLLLDIDGVLNPFAAARCPAGYTEYDLFPGEEPVRLCRSQANGSPSSPDLVRVAGQRWKIEESFQTGKELAGLDEHQVRTWTSWHR
jgi:hypothetical protein